MNNSASGKRGLTTWNCTNPIGSYLWKGYEVCKHLKASEQTRDIPVIFISALDQPFNKVNAFSVGGVDYITKPFALLKVLACIENQLRLCRLQLQLVEQKNKLLQKHLEARRQAEVEIRLLLATPQAISHPIPFTQLCKLSWR